MPEGRRFHLIEKLGAGAFGTVYLAELESIGGFRKQVALKILRPELGDTSDAGRRLRDEARMLGRLQHPNIVKVDDLVKLDGRYAVVMEYVHGHDLEVMLEALGEPLPAAAALQIAELVARALAGASGTSTTMGEALNLVHRDIKPSNVRITADGQVKVLDFGIARADFEEREARTERVRYGSIGYMSPERLLGDEETSAGDVYALWAVLYELIVGEAYGRAELAPGPFEDKLEQACERVKAATLEPLGEESAAALAEHMGRGMAYDVEDRPDAAEVALALRSLHKGAQGEDLEAWTARCVPQVDAMRRDQREPAQGVLSEQTMAAPTTGSTLVPKNPSEAFPVLTESFTAPSDVGSQAAPLSAPVPAPSESGIRKVPPPLPPDPLYLNPRVLGALAALVVVLIGAAVFSMMSGGDDAADAVVDAEPAVSAPADPPEVQPTPAEPPPEEAPPPEGAAEEPAEEPPTEAPPTEAPPSDAQADRAPPEGSAAPPPAEAQGGEAQGAEEQGGEEPAEQAPPSGPRLRAVKFAVAGASAVKAVCGDRQASGGSSALVRDLNAGSCAITATIDGAQAQTRFTVDRARGVDCALEGTELTCR